MKHLLLIFALLLLTRAMATPPRFHGIYGSLEYGTNLHQSVYGGGLDYEVRFSIDSMIHLASLGLGGDRMSDGTFLTDVRFSWALTQGWVCHVFWSERYPEFYCSLHYRFNRDFTRQYLCPEIGRNFRICTWLFLTPALNYYFNLHCTCNWKQNFYPTIKLVLKRDNNLFH